jgi:hypothetical protein
MATSIASTASTDSLALIPDTLSVSYLPNYETISATTIDRGTNKYLSSFLDEIKVFEPSRSDATNLTKIVHVSAKCFRSMRKSADPHSLYINVGVDHITDAYCSCKAG